MRVDFATSLITEELTEGVHQVYVPFRVIISDHETVVRVDIGVGFITDFASVPRIPFAYLLFGGVGTYAAVLHDALYSNAPMITVTDVLAGQPYHVKRGWADGVFKAALEARGISKLKSTPMYLGVRVKGAKYYQRKR